MPFGFVFDHREDYELTCVHSNHSNLWDLRDGPERRVRRRWPRPQHQHHRGNHDCPYHLLPLNVRCHQDCPRLSVN